MQTKMTPMDWVEFWQDFDDDPEDVEGLIFRNNAGKWIAVFAMDNRDYRCRVNYNPWTGEELS